MRVLQLVLLCVQRSRGTGVPLLQHFEPEEMATVLCVAFAPPYHTARLSCAGHPPPVLATPGARNVFVEVDVTPPLGVVKDVPRSLQTADVSEGTVLFMYTDGLIERRGESIELGLDRVRNAVNPDHPEVVCHRVMSSLVGATVVEDDIAVLAIRRSIDQTNETMRHPK
jgi:serine phosphatase RsbU (regulator of sigma subunit)